MGDNLPSDQDCLSDSVDNNFNRIPNEPYQINFTKLILKSFSLFDLRNWYWCCKSVLIFGKNALSSMRYNLLPIVNGIVPFIYGILPMIWGFFGTCKKYCLSTRTKEPHACSARCFSQCPLCRAHQQGRLTFQGNSMTRVPELDNREYMFFMAPVRKAYLDKSISTDEITSSSLEMEESGSRQQGDNIVNEERTPPEDDEEDERTSPEDHEREDEVPLSRANKSLPNGSLLRQRPPKKAYTPRRKATAVPKTARKVKSARRSRSASRKTRRRSKAES